MVITPDAIDEARGLSRRQCPRAKMIEHHDQLSHIGWCLDDPASLVSLGVSDARRVREIEDGYRPFCSGAVRHRKRVDLHRDPWSLHQLGQPRQLAAHYLRPAERGTQRGLTDHEPAERLV